MANRPVFKAIPRPPYVSVIHVDFPWSAGLSVSQKQKNVRALHECFVMRFPGERVLEASRRSQQGGERFSAFMMVKQVPSLGKAVPVECVYQAGKVFGKNGPFLDLLTAEPRDAKRDERLRENGPITGFSFEGRPVPSVPTHDFYDGLYIGALLEQPELAAVLMDYDAFTDIEFNPERSQNCQAYAAARFVGMRRAGLTADEIRAQFPFLG